MCAYIKCTYKFNALLLFFCIQTSESYSEKSSDAEIGSENNFFSTLKSLYLSLSFCISIDIYAKEKKLKDFQFSSREKWKELKIIETSFEKMQIELNFVRKEFGKRIQRFVLAMNVVRIKEI